MTSWVCCVARTGGAGKASSTSRAGPAWCGCCSGCCSPPTPPPATPSSPRRRGTTSRQSYPPPTSCLSPCHGDASGRLSLSGRLSWLTSVTTGASTSWWPSCPSTSATSSRTTWTPAARQDCGRQYRTGQCGWPASLSPSSRTTSSGTRSSPRPSSGSAPTPSPTWDRPFVY